MMNHLLRHGMPIEKCEPRPATFQEEKRTARDAEKALLAILSACALTAGRLSRVEWPSGHALNQMLQGLYTPNISDRLRVRMSRLDLSLQYLILTDLFEADLTGATLHGADLTDADLTNAKHLTQDQINSARGNQTTKLPADLTRPDSWNDEKS